MNLYTIVFIIVTILILVGLGLFGLLISKLDKWIDRRERLGAQSIYKSQTATKPEEKQKSKTE